MATYTPPSEIVSIFNYANFNAANYSLTLAQADARYLQLSGGTISGPLFCQSTLSVRSTLSINGNIVGSGSNNISAFSNVSSTSITIGSSTLTNTEASYLTSITTGTASASKALVLDSSRNITNINSLTATNLFGTLQTASQPNITSVGNLTSLTMFGDISMSGHNISSANTISATTFTGTISTAAQPNITSLGTLSSLTMGGNITMGSNSITGANVISATTLTGTISTAAQPNITSLGTLTALTMGGTITMGSNNISGAGTISCSTLTISTAFNITSTTDATSISTGSFTTLGGIGIAKSIWGGTTLNIAGQSNLNGISNQGNLLTADVAGSGGLFRIVNSAGVCYIQTGTAVTSGSNTDLFFGNVLQAFNASSRRLMLKAGGNFGIGTYSPQTSCSVNGTLRISNSSDGTESDYSELSQATSGGCTLKLTGSLYQNLRLQQSGATTNINNATGIDMGTAYQQRALALTATNGGVSGSEFYGFGTNSGQALDIMSNSVIRFINGSTPGTVGSLRMLMNSTGLQIGNGSTVPGCALDVNGTMRAVGFTNPSTGTGLELNYDSGNSKSNIFSYDRGAGSYKDLNINDKMWVGSNGRIGIGTTGPSYPLDVRGFVALTSLASFGYLASSGAGTATGFTNRRFSIQSEYGIIVLNSEIDVFSDTRMKKDIIRIDDDITSRFMSVNPIRFKYKASDYREHLGYSAQELMAQGLTELVGFTQADDELEEMTVNIHDGSTIRLSGKERLCVNLLETIPLLHRALQIQQSRLEEQQKQIDELRAMLVPQSAQAVQAIQAAQSVSTRVIRHIKAKKIIKLL